MCMSFCPFVLYHAVSHEWCQQDNKRDYKFVCLFLQIRLPLDRFLLTKHSLVVFNTIFVYVYLSTISGKMNSLFSLVETLAALMFDPTYTALYARTVTVFSGAVYVFSSCMTLPAISVLM